MRLSNIKAEYIKSVYLSDDIPKKTLPEFVICGRSNSGKSTFLNKICNRRKLAFSSKKPGRTNQINFYLINNQVHIIDVPGYGFAKVGKKEKNRWIDLLNKFFLDRDFLNGMIITIDSRRGLMQSDKELIEFTKNKNTVFYVVLTKIDKLKKNEIIKITKKVEADLKKYSNFSGIELSGINTKPLDLKIIKFIEDNC